MKKVISVFVVSMLGGCVANTQVPVQGAQNDRIHLSGAWEGAFEGLAGQQGRITFNLETGRHTAEGSVRLYDKKTNKTQILKISGVKVDGREFVGRMEPFRSPECDCLVQTEFRGLVQGDVIEGTFVASESGTDEKERTGNWSLYRDEK